ncbi:FMN-linked oxidoreductase, partial [Backusella circina FSU 941]
MSFITTSTSSSAILSPLKLGTSHLQHRIVHAPTSRRRAEEDATPSTLMKEYYSQRATEGGLLITEATFIDATAGSYKKSPGIYTKKQIAAWREITDQVHKKGGVIYVQLWHVGRASISKENKGLQPVSASPIPITSDLHASGDAYDTPRELSIPEIKEITDKFKQAAINAIELAGFDGVEIHAANGYLLDQFINTSSNKRSDIYGGSIENRARFTLEVVNAVSNAITPQRTGVRFSPWSDIQDMEDDTPYETWGYITNRIQEKYPDLAYLHFVEARHQLSEDIAFSDVINNSDKTLDPFRRAWKGNFISASGYTYDPKLAIDVAERTGNLIAFGRHFIANPDLVQRIRNDWPFNKYDRSTFYTPGAKGYTDYPF